MGESKKKFSNKIYKVKGKNVFKLIGLIMIMAAVISGCAKSEKAFDEEEFVKEIKPNI